MTILARLIVAWFCFLPVGAILYYMDQSHKVPVDPPRPTLEVVYTQSGPSRATYSREAMIQCGKAIKELRPANKGVPESLFNYAYQQCLVGMGATI